MDAESGTLSDERRCSSASGRLYLTLVHAELAGDAWFPEYDQNQWQAVSREDHSADADNPYPYSFVVYDRR